MALALSEPTAEILSTTNAATYAMAAFTPTADALLVVMVFASGTAAAGTMTGGGLTWNLITSTAYNSTSTAYLFAAKVSASPVSTAVTFACTGDNATGVCMGVVQITGTYVGVKQFTSNATTAANPTLTFSTALSTGNAYVAGFGVPRSPPSSTPPGGGAWSEIFDGGYSTPTSGGTMAYRNGGETGTTVTFTSASGAYGALGVEVWEAPAPTVSAITPNSGSTVGGTSITDLAGTNFVTGATVEIGSASATSVGFTSATQLTCTTPAGTAGAQNVVVTNPDGQTSGSSGDGLFTYVLPAPTVSTITPDSGSTAGGTNITDLAGTGFVSGATVTVGGNPATSVSFSSSTQLTFTTPAGTVGAQDVVVTNPDAQTSGSSGNGIFTYTAAGSRYVMGWRS